jgi:hypothetical protein
MHPATVGANGLTKRLRSAIDSRMQLLAFSPLLTGQRRFHHLAPAVNREF